MKTLAIVILAIVALSAVLFALLTRYLAYQVATQYVPTGHFAEIGGARLHYREYSVDGDSELLPMVFIHGASGNLRDLEAPLAKRLEGRGRMIFLDRPGHGHSDRGNWTDVHLPSGQARALSDLLQHLGVEKAIIIGHSFGGSVAAAFAVESPDMTAGLVFLAPATHPWPGGGVTWHYDVTNIPILGWLFSETLAIPFGHLVFRDGVKGVFKPERIPENYLQRTGVKLLLRPTVFRNNAQDVGSLYTAVQELAPRYPSIKKPTSIITGDSDDVVLANIHSTGLESDIMGSKLVWLEGVGHSPAWSAPEVVIAEIERVSNEARQAAK